MMTLLLPLAVALTAALLVLGLLAAHRSHLSTWKDELRDLERAAREPVQPAQVVAQETGLRELMVREEESSYLGTDSFQGLVVAVERLMRTAGQAKDSLEQRAWGGSSTRMPLRHARPTSRSQALRPALSVIRTRHFQLRA